MSTQYSVTLTAIPGIPLIKEGDDLGTIILQCAGDAGTIFEDGDVLVVTSKIVSKAEGRLVSLASVQPSEKAIEIARIRNRVKSTFLLRAILTPYGQGTAHSGTKHPVPRDQSWKQ